MNTNICIIALVNNFLKYGLNVVQIFILFLVLYCYIIIIIIVINNKSVFL